MLYLRRGVRGGEVGGRKREKKKGKRGSEVSFTIPEKIVVVEKKNLIGKKKGPSTKKIGPKGCTRLLTSEE